MTTNVTVKTHSWPCEVTITDATTWDFANSRGQSFRSDTQTVGPHSERTFHLTQTQGVSFRELPLPEVTLSEPDGEGDNPGPAEPATE